jgi:uncharacterized protein YoxC
MQLTEQMESYERIFKETQSIEDLIKLHQQVKELQNDLSFLFTSKLQQLTEDIQQYTNNNLRHESTQLSTSLMNINNRYRVLTQDLNRFIERIDERIESETNNSIESYHKLIESLRVKLTRIRDDYRLTIDVKQRLINVNLFSFLLIESIFSYSIQEISYSLTNERVYVQRAIENIKLTRSLFNHEYDVNEIDDECQAIDDEWVEFSSDFDDQTQEINRIETDLKKFDSEISQTYQWLREQENAFQLMIANQPTLELKLKKLTQIKVCKILFFNRIYFFRFQRPLSNT